MSCPACYPKPRQQAPVWLGSTLGRCRQCKLEYLDPGWQEWVNLLRLDRTRILKTVGTVSLVGGLVAGGVLLGILNEQTEIADTWRAEQFVGALLGGAVAFAVLAWGWFGLEVWLSGRRSRDPEYAERLRDVRAWCEEVLRERAAARAPKLVPREALEPPKHAPGIPGQTDGGPSPELRGQRAELARRWKPHDKSATPRNARVAGAIVLVFALALFCGSALAASHDVEVLPLILFLTGLVMGVSGLCTLVSGIPWRHLPSWVRLAVGIAVVFAMFLAAAVSIATL